MTRLALFVLLGELLVLLGGAPSFDARPSHRDAISAVASHASVARLPRGAQAKRTADPRRQQRAAFAPSSTPPAIARAASARACFVARVESFPAAIAPVPCARGPPISG